MKIAELVSTLLYANTLCCLIVHTLVLYYQKIYGERCGGAGATWVLPTNNAEFPPVTLANGYIQRGITISRLPAILYSSILALFSWDLSKEAAKDFRTHEPNLLPPQLNWRKWMAAEKI